MTNARSLSDKRVLKSKLKDSLTVASVAMSNVNLARALSYFSPEMSPLGSYYIYAFISPRVRSARAEGNK